MKLAAWAGALAVPTWPVYCHGRYISEIAAFEFTVAAGFLSEVLVRMCERIWLGLARLGSVGQSLPLRCRFTIPSGHAAEISR